jgi:hypothetical protein
MPVSLALTENPAYIAGTDSMNIFQGIIDIYYENDHINFQDAWDCGIGGILHETSKGLYKKDTLYTKRKNRRLTWAFYGQGTTRSARNLFCL